MCWRPPCRIFTSRMRIAAIDPAAQALDEAGRFPFCTPAGLKAVCAEAGMRRVVVQPIEVLTTFPDFEAFWHPFTLGAGPAPGYCVKLDPDARQRLRDRQGAPSRQACCRLLSPAGNG